MKFIKRTSILAALALASSLASAQWYGGVSVGQGNTDFKNADYASTAAVTDSHKSDAAAYKLVAGYSLDKAWALEGGYAVFGRTEYRQANAAGAEQKRIVENSALSVALKYNYALNEKWGVSAKAGLTHNFSDQITESNSAIVGGFPALDNKHTAATTGIFGVGVQYKLNPKTTLVAEYEDYGSFGEKDVIGRTNSNLVSIGITRAF